MNKQKIAEVIEVSPVRLSSDETRSMLRMAQSDKPMKVGWSGVYKGLIELGLVMETPIETAAARASRLTVAWRQLRLSAIARDLGLAVKAFSDIQQMGGSDEPEKGVVLTALGREVARGITVRMTKR